MDTYFATFLAVILPQIPLYLLDLIGLGIAIARRERHPKVSLLAGVYFLGSFVLGLAGLGFSLMPLYMTTQGASVSDFSTMLGLLNFLMIALRIVFMIVLMFAIFGWRDQKPSASNLPISLPQGESNG